MHDPEPLTNSNTELAKYRTLFASNRTMLAWIRTALSLISFGFGIPTIVKAIDATRVGETIDPHRFSVIFGLAFIGVGVFAMAASLIEHRSLLKRIRTNDFTYRSSTTTDIVGIALILIGVISFLGVLLRSVTL